MPRNIRRCACGTDVRDRLGTRHGRSGRSIGGRAGSGSTPPRRRRRRRGTVRRGAVQGCGIACKSRLDIADDLPSGRLIDLFPGTRCELVPLYAVYPSRQYQQARLQALLQFLQAVFRHSSRPNRLQTLIERRAQGRIDLAHASQPGSCPTAWLDIKPCRRGQSS
ncbi:hypothetical protein GPA25_19450 [Aromatoleum diolicum]|uniref:LysR substrate-binding domain-containing protein n=1 Tax=Aromatoleum diolicum TaxID=75796 RepID=A0ABX1QHE8_9RHOO|nr:hypothetical protein [Aromatoleum diolicum]